MPWPISKSRKWRKFWVAMCGRRRPTRPVAIQTPEAFERMALGLPSLAEAGPGRSRVRRLPSYTRPDFDERFAMWRLAGEGHSAREIGRQLGRDHHSVRRHLERHRGEGLALDLALHGKRGSAREMVQRLGNEHDFATEVEKFIATFEAWVKVEQRRIDEIANACLTRGSVTRAVPSETRPAV